MAYKDRAKIYITATTIITPMSAIGDRAIAGELRAIRKELEYIRKHMVDVDMILTAEEERILERGLKEYKEGKTRSLDDVVRDRVAV